MSSGRCSERIICEVTVVYVIMPKHHGMSQAKKNYEEFRRAQNMSGITRVTDPNKGPLDGVELQANGVVTRFITNSKKKTVAIKTQEVAPCKIMASYEVGTISLSIPSKALMVSVRLDEVMAVIQEAAASAADLCGPVKPKEGGPLPLYCNQCRCWVPDTANSEMKKDGLYAHSHLCGRMNNGEIPDAEA